MNTKDARRLETRTKIQLGGLIVKAGLADLFDIEMGADLQLNMDDLERATTLLGALIHLEDTLRTNPELIQKMHNLGRSHMR